MLLCIKLLLVLFGLYNQLPPVYAGDGELISRDSRCFEPLFFSVVPAGTSKYMVILYQDPVNDSI